MGTEKVVCHHSTPAHSAVWPSLPVRIAMASREGRNSSARVGRIGDRRVDAHSWPGSDLSMEGRPILSIERSTGHKNTAGILYGVRLLELHVVACLRVQ